MHHCLRAKPLLFNAIPFLNPKLEVYEKTKPKKKKKPGGKLASYYTHFIFFYSFCFYFTAAQL